MILVKFFAAAADAAGRRQAEGDWSGFTGPQLLSTLTEQFPGLARLAPVLAIAVNREYINDEYRLADGDEVALIPPVSGGAGDRPADRSDAGSKPLFDITDAPLSADDVAARVTNPYSGATLVFVGTTREWTKGKRTVYLEYEAYPEMALEQLQRIGREIEDQWPDARTAIVHRVGRVEVTEPSVIIAVATPHRSDGFAACRYAIDRLKQIVPIWKKEVWEDGEEWVGSQLGPDWMQKL